MTTGWRLQTTSAKWRVVIQSDVATFKFRNSATYNKVQMNQKIDVYYREVYRAVYDNDVVQERKFSHYEVLRLGK